MVRMDAVRCTAVISKLLKINYKDGKQFPGSCALIQSNVTRLICRFESGLLPCCSRIQVSAKNATLLFYQLDIRKLIMSKKIHYLISDILENLENLEKIHLKSECGNYQELEVLSC
jgi:hypothetical protein